MLSLSHDAAQWWGNNEHIDVLSCFIPGGKPTNGGSASWSRGFSDRTAPVRRRPVDQDFKREVKKPISSSPIPPPRIFTEPILITVN